MKSDSDEECRQFDEETLMKELKFTSVLERELLGKNLSQLSREIGMSKSLLHDWYRGRRSPNARNFPQLLKLAHHLGLTLEELIFDGPTKEKSTLASTTFADSGNQYRVQIEKIKK